MLAVSTDAHSVHELALLPYGVAQARRGWVDAGGLINTQDLTELLDWLTQPKAARPSGDGP